MNEVPDDVQRMVGALRPNARPNLTKVWPPAKEGDSWTVVCAVRQREGRRTVRATWSSGERWSVSAADGMPRRTGVAPGAAVTAIVEDLRRPATSPDAPPTNLERIHQMLLSTASSIETAHRKMLPSLDEEVAALLGWACLPTPDGTEAWQCATEERPTEGPAQGFTREIAVIVEHSISPRTPWSIACDLDGDEHWARTARVGAEEGRAPTHERALLAATLRHLPAKMEDSAP